MKLHRFLGAYDLGSKHLNITDKDVVKQIKAVLRLKPGNEIILSDSVGRDARASIVSVKRNCIEVDISEVERNLREPRSHVILYCSILKKENFETVVQKATEIGVREVVPLICERTVKLAMNKTRLERIINEAAEQAGRAFVPELAQTVNLDNAIETASENDINLFYDPEGETLQRPIRAGKIGVFIGPEGGWTEEELKMARTNSFIVVRLGKLTFRAETAAIVAAYLAAMS